MDESPTLPTPAETGTPHKPPFEPFRFGKYEILEELGRGGMGVVYKAYQDDLDRVVAVKMILAHHLSVPGFAERFHAEARAAAKVSHPNVVSVFENGVHQDQHYIAMQFVEGHSLAELFAAGGLDLQDAVRIVRDVAQAVHFLHERQILHRDLKPSNIMVTEDGRPLLTDFGLALIRGTVDDRAHGIVGTPGYVAPEIVRYGSGSTSERSDIYSLGATLYEAATGRPPFADRSPVEAFVDVLARDPVPPRQIDREIPLALETIIIKCLERSPEKRYGSAEELAFDLQQFSIGEPISATPPAGLLRARRWIRGHPALAARLFGIGAFLLLTGWNAFVAGVVSRAFFLSVATWLAVWTGAAVVCHLLERLHGYPARVTWATVDAVVLTVLLHLADGVGSSLLLAYPLWVAMSGFWNRVSLVVLTTGLALASYGVLVADAEWNRPDLKVSSDRHLVFVSVVLLTGIVIGMQTRRARALAQYLARRR